MDTLIDRVRAADPVRPGEFAGLDDFDALVRRLEPPRRRRRPRRRLLALPAGGLAAVVAAFALIPASAPQASEILRRATDAMALDQGVLYAQTHRVRTQRGGASEDYGVTREWVSADAMRMVQVSGTGDAPAGAEEVSRPGSLSRYTPDGKVRTVPGMQAVPGEIFRAADLLRAAQARQGVDVIDETGDAFVLRWREPSGPPHQPVIEMTLWVDKDTYAPLKLTDHSYGLDAEGKPFDSTLTETVDEFRRLPDTPENRKLLEHQG
jgi:hypothetical protein